MKRILLTITAMLLLSSVGYCKNDPLRLTVKSDKQVYEVGEEIKIAVIVTNTLKSSYFIDPESVDIDVYDRSNGVNLIAPYFTAKPSPKPSSVEKPALIEIKGGGSYTKSYNFGTWQINIQEKGKDLGKALYIKEYANTYTLRAVCTYEQGGYTSRPITIEVVRKNASADYPTSGLASKAKAIAEDFMFRQYYKDAYKAKASPIQEFDGYVDCYFKRKIPIDVKGDGLVRVDKRTWEPKWIGSE